MRGPLPAYVKQAAAAKTIGILCRNSATVAESFLKMDVVKNLIYATGNTEHYNSQREASLTLEVSDRSIVQICIFPGQDVRTFSREIPFEDNLLKSL